MDNEKNNTEITVACADDGVRGNDGIMLQHSMCTGYVMPAAYKLGVECRCDCHKDGRNSSRPTEAIERYYDAAD